MTLHDEDPRWKLKTILESYRHNATLLIEKKKELEIATEPAEMRILTETIQNIGEEFKGWADLLYTFILSYNHYKEKGDFQEITAADILNAQLVQDEVAAMLKEKGINISYTQTDQRQ